jgi:hypothetical protein
MDAELRQQPTTNEGAYDSNDEIAAQTRCLALFGRPAIRR